ncbi:MAG: hypothetical protein QG623_301 [Patescibacteria group bacterium]|nr:hypothetical protein [Patescibacteria group bacterium]
MIDGRILALAEAGFLNDAELVSTNIILDELQYLADEGDSFKRGRARYGLEVLNKLSALGLLNLVTKNLPKSELEVDQQLLNLAKSSGAQLFTADFNLAQRARVEGVEILSPNDLSESLKPQILPGENFTIKLIQKGDDRGQAVGYLPDGTMVVAENSANKIGQTLDLKSSKIIQTTAGRIVFAQQVNSGRTPKDSKAAPKPRVPRLSNPQPEPNLTKSQTRSPRQAQTQPQSQPRNQRRPQNNRPKNKEDSLIDAINGSDSTR